MKERPILFSGEMVRAILAGQKTQTRRVVRKQECIPRDWQDGGWAPEAKEAIIRQLCPYGQTGDWLWVQESFKVVAGHHEHPKFSEARKVRYMADDTKSDWLALPDSHINLPTSELRLKVNPGRFMPRWASRINLEITGLRVERVQEISAWDCTREGLKSGSEIKYRFEALWDSINANRKDKDGNILPYSWADNPWVWVVEFRRERT